MRTLLSITALDDGSGLSRHLFDDGLTIDKQVNVSVTPSSDEIALLARSWRNEQLMETDHIPAITDHPQRAAYLTYRTALRDWPSTADFPATKPTLGS